MSKVVIIGGGPAGMMAAYMAAYNHNVTILEKNEKLGKKLFITGKGRCNITNACDVEDFMKQIINNPKFMYSALYTFTPDMAIEFMETMGTKTKVERGNRVFPISDKSSDVIGAFKRALNQQNVNVQLNTHVTGISKKENEFIISTKSGTIKSDVVLIATGGVSYVQTGSTGDGYTFAKKWGHKIVDTEGGLVPLETVEDTKPLQGLALKNVSVKILKKNKELCDGFGEMLFTHFGLSGPIILSASSYFKDDGKGYDLEIDLKPKLSEEQLDKRLLRDFEKYNNKDIINGLNDLLPKKIIPYIIGRTSMDERTKIHQITKELRLELVYHIKHLKYRLKGKYDINQAIITQGGVSVKDINPNTMASKIVPGLYFAGEVIDVDALTGGYNLQIAYATGYLAGISIE